MIPSSSSSPLFLKAGRNLHSVLIIVGDFSLCGDLVKVLAFMWGCMSNSWRLQDAVIVAAYVSVPIDDGVLVFCAESLIYDSILFYISCPVLCNFILP